MYYECFFVIVTTVYIYVYISGKVHSSGNISVCNPVVYMMRTVCIYCAAQKQRHTNNLLYML